MDFFSLWIPPLGICAAMYMIARQISGETHDTQAAPYCATLQSTELRRILLSYAAPYRATPNPTELRHALNLMFTNLVQFST
jgi:hypothetical protein